MGSFCRSASIGMMMLPREIEACHHRGGLPEIAAQVDHFDVRIGGGHLVEHGSGPVGAAVIDEYQFPWCAQALENNRHTFMQRNDAFDFVKNGNGDGYHELGTRRYYWLIIISFSSGPVEGKLARTSHGLAPRRATLVSNRTGSLINRRLQSTMSAFGHRL